MRKLKLLIALCMVAIAASASKTVYLNPGPWNVDGARYALNMFTDGVGSAWVDFTDNDGDGIFTAIFDDSYAKMILVRMDGANTVNDWANKWNQTANIDAPYIDGLTYTINKMDGDNCSYTISGNNNTYLYNVGANAYLDAGASWGTHAALKSPGFVLDVTMSNGKYVIATPKYNGNNHWFNGNGYVDSGWTEWEYAPVEGQNAITLKATNEGNLYVLAAAGMYNVTRSAEVPATNMGWWRFVTDTKRNDVSGATKATPVELTHKINNPRFDDDNSGWEDKPARGGNTGGTNGDADSYDDRNPCAEHYNKTYNTYQTLTGLPNGFYKVSVQGFYREGGFAAAAVNHNGSTESLNALLYANGKEQPLQSIFTEAGKVSCDGTVTTDGIEGAFPNNMNAASSFFSANLYWNTVDRVAVTDGTLTFGVKKETAVGADWTIFDNFRVQYLGGVCNSAIPLPHNGNINADQWYKYTVALAGDYMITAGTAADIIQTNNGIQFEDEATGDAITTGTVALTAGTVIYYKSTTDNTLTIKPASYEYEVSEATTDIAYIQPGNTVTVSFTATTNSGENLTQDYSDVTFAGAAIDYTATTSGFTFTVPSTVTAGQTYTLFIPAEVIGYTNGNTFNAEQNITLTTPAAFDGTYFFKVENEGALNGQYLSRGKDYGTHAAIDKYGLAIKVATDGQNKTTLKPFDTNRFYRMGNAYDCWADQTTDDDNARFNLIASNGHIRIHAFSNADAEDYFKYDDSDVAETTKIWADSHSGGNSGNVLEFSLESGAEHAVAMQALKDGQATTAAAAAFASGNYASLEGINTVAALEAELTANYIQGDFVSPSAIESVLEKYQGAQPNPSPETVYSNTIHISEPGFYKFSMQAFYRAGSNDRVKEMVAAGVDFSPVVLFFGESQTQIKSVYDELSTTALSDDWGNYGYNNGYIPNNMTASLKAFQNGMYHNDVWFYAPAAGDYTYGVKYLGFANDNAQWFIYSPESVTITSYAAAADATDYDNLANAIAAYDNAAWGFEEGEYAPYNNAEARANIAAAKALDTNATNSKLIVNSLIDDIALVANTEEVNAFYDGDFSECAEDNASPLDYTPAGWTASENFRMMLKNTETYPGLADASIPSAVFTWSGGITYGETVGYEMPLKANTTYVLKLKAAGWENQTRSGITVSVLNAEDGLAATDLGTPDRDIKGNEQNTAGMTSFVKYFKTGAAGNYVFHVQSGNNIVLTDFDLRRPSNVYAVVGSADFFSGSWDQETQDDILEEAGAGVYSKTYANLTLDKQITITYKFIKKDRVEATSATTWYPEGEDQTISIPVKGIYDITFTFTEEGSVMTGVATKTAEAVTISDKLWATTVTNSALDFSASEDVEAYTAKVENNEVVLTNVDNVQAETGLVLKGTAAGTYYIPVIASSETDKGNLMFSSTESYNTWGDNTFYGLTAKLVDDKYEAQFAKIDRSNGEVTIPAGKAFLMISGSGARELKVVFADDTTGINAIAAKNGAEGVYNLNGQRVTAPAKGLYIVNGKKVVLK